MQTSEDTEGTGRSGSPCQKAAINVEMWKEREMRGDPCALGLVLKVLVSSQGFFDRHRNKILASGAIFSNLKDQIKLAKWLKNDCLISFKDIKDPHIKHAKEGLFIRLKNIY